MENKVGHWLEQSLVTLMVVAVTIGPNPWPGAAGLLVLLAYRLGDRYFHDSFHDENKALIAKLSFDFQKLKSKQDQVDLKNAFGGKVG